MTLEHYKAVKALIRYKNKFLVLEKENFVGGDYDLPGGRKLPNEDDESALNREVDEEVNLEITIVRELNSWVLELPGKGIHLDGKTYLCDSTSNSVKLSKEHTGYSWMERKQIETSNIPSWFRTAISKL